MSNDSDYRYVNVRRYLNDEDGFDFTASETDGDAAAGEQKTIIGGFKSMSGMDSETESVGTRSETERSGADALDLGAEPGDMAVDSFDFL